MIKKKEKPMRSQPSKSSHGSYPSCWRPSCRAPCDASQRTNTAGRKGPHKLLQRRLTILNKRPKL